MLTMPTPGGLLPPPAALAFSRYAIYIRGMAAPRKPASERKVLTTIRFDQFDRAALKRLCKLTGLTAAAAIRLAIRESVRARQQEKRP
jgi:hypothetical protein